VVAAALLMAGAAWAKGPGGGGHGGGFHGGGGHGGGFHGGGGHGGGFHGGISQGGGFHSGGFHGGSTHFGSVHYGSVHYGDFHHRGFHHGYYPFIGYDTPYGYYSSGGYYTPYEYYPSNDPGYGSAPDQGYSNCYEEVTPSTLSPEREFQSPPLKPGQYTYEIRARWTENGHDITRIQKVPVSPGDHSTLLFLTGGGSD